MTRKRFKKLLMAEGCSRNKANALIKNIRSTPYEELYILLLLKLCLVQMEIKYSFAMRQRFIE